MTHGISMVLLLVFLHIVLLVIPSLAEFPSHSQSTSVMGSLKQTEPKRAPPLQKTTTPSPTPSVPATPLPSRDYPCKKDYTLLKFYTPEFVLYYICELRTREAPEVSRATCRDGYYQVDAFCVRRGEWCPWPNRESTCAQPVCGERGEFRIINHRDFCFTCPKGFYLDEYGSTPSCYGVFKEQPQCRSFQYFNVQTAMCE